MELGFGEWKQLSESPGDLMDTRVPPDHSGELVNIWSVRIQKFCYSDR